MRQEPGPLQLGGSFGSSFQLKSAFWGTSLGFRVWGFRVLGFWGLGMFRFSV